MNLLKGQHLQARPGSLRKVPVALLFVQPTRMSTANSSIHSVTGKRFPLGAMQVEINEGEDTHAHKHDLQHNSRQSHLITSSNNKSGFHLFASKWVRPNQN